MKLNIAWFALFAAALGVWSGVHAWVSPSQWMTIQVVMVTVLGGNLLFATWRWSRSAPGSSDAFFLPDLILMNIALLIAFVPRLFWPGDSMIVMIASVVSGVFAMTLGISAFRRSRRLRADRLRHTGSQSGAL